MKLNNKVTWQTEIVANLEWRALFQCLSVVQCNFALNVYKMTYVSYIVIKCPPPIPLLWKFTTPTHMIVAMAASTVDPAYFARISLEQNDMHIK